LKRLWILGHTLGLSCLGGAVFLQCLVFFDIATQGYFAAIEHNPVVLSSEIGLTMVAVVYFIFLWKRFIRSIGEHP
jgi:hypothetical protein